MAASEPNSDSKYGMVGSPQARNGVLQNSDCPECDTGLFEIMLQQSVKLFDLFALK